MILHQWVYHVLLPWKMPIYHLSNNTGNMTSLYSIIKADYLQRTRSYVFLITMLVSVAMAYTFVPPVGAQYSTVRIGDYIGENNSAWIGHVTAIMASIFLWLIGFYLVNNGIKRDRETGVGQIVATTSISNFKYLLAKACSNFLVLLTIVIIIMGMALGLAVFRGGQYPFELKQFLLPYLFATIPSIFCVAILAVIAEVIFGKYTNLQNVAFFFLFPIIIALQSKSNNSIIASFDVLGIKQLTDGMVHVVNTQFSQNVDQVSSGFIFGDKVKNKYFLFEGSTWTAVYILSRFIWIGIFLALLYVSSFFFHRFDVKEGAEYKTKKKSKKMIELNLPLKEIHPTSLVVATTDYRIWPFVKTELLILFRTGPRWFWLVNLGGFIALFLMPLTLAHTIALPVLWFLQVNRWATISTKEKYFNTHYFTYASYKPLQRLLTAQIIAGTLLAIVLASPLLIRYAFNNNYSSVISILLGATFIIAFSVFSGIIFGGKRLFEIVFFMLTYMNVNGAVPLDYFGGFHQGISYIMVILIIIGAMLAGAFMVRGYEIRNQ
ncbi:MAG: hypothetical protein ABI761_09100 [Saprospiraceae bacterium]